MDDKTKNILKRRAAALARPQVEPRPASEFVETLEFRLGAERFAVETSFVREVYPLKEVTPLPGTPDFILGAMNVRGQVVTINDLARWLELPESARTAGSKVLILRDGEMECGFLADEVVGMRAIACDELEETLPTLTGIRAECLKGVTRDRTVLLDAGKVLASPKLIIGGKQ
ncbi:MAG: purine-binding chemotaxis protein CheW [Deltaproteobacteria bacterium]|nr:purine-binding chemotaxis protein CheW [Deltaproteobacteria bacterium]